MKRNNSHIYFKKNSVDNTVKILKKIISKKSHKQIIFNLKLNRFTFIKDIKFN